MRAVVFGLCRGNCDRLKREREGAGAGSHRKKALAKTLAALLEKNGEGLVCAQQKGTNLL